MFAGLLVGLTVFGVGRAIHQRYWLRGLPPPDRPHSPAWYLQAWAWAKWLLTGDSDSDSDSDIVVTGTKWGRVYADPDQPGHWKVLWRRRHARVPLIDPVAPPKPAGPSPLERWIAASIANGARSGDIVREARRKFGASESTTRRAMRRARHANRGAA
jgi:hypothetical protein